MIAIIIYVSTLERIKEIRVIISLDGEKKDASYLFNAETFNIGSEADVIGRLVFFCVLKNKKKKPKIFIKMEKDHIS